jgi:hypothetical protein
MRLAKECDSKAADPTFAGQCWPLSRRLRCTLRQSLPTTSANMQSATATTTIHAVCATVLPARDKQPEDCFTKTGRQVLREPGS